ncbi:hypothetical protein [Nakamurella multipartita]|uniref:Uncharacterized protein n=1 Tax=Nakamurella multipartita (strain ATCC 700099 / DSM 44233 / CIP 104796 / JCM 9543 / NBRC 105858 / Y-104) TaxID=479431 RepID=C8X7Q5_NAKMY|nr:hypothetical protein [Nakamurella multipartita]ACV80908.1 hypothetical protein Namu_4629 [Nakamurella multipartita DSM 44233]
MSPSEPGRGLFGLPGRLLTGAIVLLLAAWALSEAVRLITPVWVQLVVIGGVLLLVAGGIAWWRQRRNGW